jgi:hypothetical protein
LSYQNDTPHFSKRFYHDFQQNKKIKFMKRIALATACLMFAFSALQAQTVEEVLAKYYKATGAENWKNLESTVSAATGTAQGFTFPLTIVNTRPNMTKITGEIQGIKFTQVSFDGDSAWTQMPFAGTANPTTMSKEDAAEFADETFEDELYNYAAKGHKVTIEGTEEIEGTKTIKLKIVRKSGDEKFYFLDAETMLPVMIRTFGKSGEMKGIPTEMVLSDYKAVNGVMFPMAMEQKVKGQTGFSMKIDKVEANAKVAKADFAKPK